jgi:chromosome segregation ATPase
MKVMTIARMENLYNEYKEIEAKERALKAQIAELEKQARACKTEKAKKGDIIAKLGSVKPTFDYYEKQAKHKALLDSYRKSGEEVDVWKDEFKEKLAKLEAIASTPIFEPCQPRQWYCQESKRWNSTAQRYYIRIENYNFENQGIERYDKSNKDYYIIVQERPELKRYKWEIETSWPDAEKYREQVTNTTKYKDLKQLAIGLHEKMAEVAAVYKKQNKELLELAPDIFDFETIRTEVDLPFEVKKKLIKVKEH